MPEHRLLEAIIAALKDAMDEQDGERITRAEIKLGEQASVTSELIESLLHEREEYGLDSADLTIEIVPILGECEKCEKVVEIDSGLCCKECGSPYVTLGDHNTVLVSSCEVER